MLNLKKLDITRGETLQTTIQIKLLPNKEQCSILKATMKSYVALVNECVGDMVTFDEYGKLTSKNVEANLPSALKNQCISDAKSIFRKYRKTKIEPVLRKPVAVWNNQNYKVTADSISFPVFLNGKTTRISVKALIPADVLDVLQTHKLGAMRITQKSGKFIAQIAVEAEQKALFGSGVMGVDLGILCPAVCYTDSGKVKFVGKNKFIRRRFKTKRKKLGKAKKLKAIRKLHNKEQRIMRDIDHKLSREIVSFAVQNKVGIIKLEKLANIRRTTRKSRKNNPSLHTWSFYRLANYIEHKAKLLGIQVEYVDPAYTSQTCPVCGKRHKTNNRNYRCECGYRSHRDLVGAKNICAA